MKPEALQVLAPNAAWPAEAMNAVERLLRRVVDLRRENEQLQTALESRIVIEQAKGVLSAQSGSSVGEAFRVMRSHARRTGEPLTAVAEAVVGRELGAAGLLRGRQTADVPAREF